MLRAVRSVRRSGPPSREGRGRAALAAGLMLLALAGACGRSPDLVRIIESEVIDSLLVAAPHTIIDLDALPVEEWYPDRVLGVHPQDSLILSGRFTFAIAGDSVYFADARARAILVAGLNGVLRRQVGRQGQGPLEFEELRGLSYGGGQFFVREGSRMQVLSRSLEYEDIVLDSYTLPSGYFGNFAASPSRMYYPCYLGHTHRVCSRDVAPPYAEGESFLPSVEYTEGGPPMNLLSVSASLDGKYVVAAFFGLPHVFVFDSAHAHVRTISLAGDAVKAHASNYLMSQPGVPGAGLRSLIYGVYVLNHEYLMVQIRELWHVIRILQDGGAVHVSTVRLRTDPAYQIREIMDVGSPSEAHLYMGYLYVTNSHLPYILRYAFPH